MPTGIYDRKAPKPQILPTKLRAKKHYAAKSPPKALENGKQDNISQPFASVKVQIKPARVPGSKAFAERKASQDLIVPRETQAMIHPMPEEPMLRFPHTLIPAILLDVSRGMSVAKAMRELGYAYPLHFYMALRRCPQYQDDYRDALAARGEHYADQIVELADEAMQARTPEEAQAYKLRVNTRQWIVSRLLPDKYGERVTLQGDAANPLIAHMVASSTDLVKKLRGGEDLKE